MVRMDQRKKSLGSILGDAAIFMGVEGAATVKQKMDAPEAMLAAGFNEHSNRAQAHRSRFKRPGRQIVLRVIPTITVAHIQNAPVCAPVSPLIAAPKIVSYMVLDSRIHRIET